MIGALGDLVEDIMVELQSPIHYASDTQSIITRRRGGSAATVAVVAARLDGHARYIGQVGDDAVGRRMVADLEIDGVEVAGIRSGVTGTVVILVDSDGERTMLTDRGDSGSLTHPDPTWLESLTTLHVPFYSLATEPMASTAQTLMEWARENGITRSVDASSASVLNSFGTAAARERLSTVGADVIFLNNEEADTLSIRTYLDAFRSSLLVVKNGANPTEIYSGGQFERSVEVPPVPALSNSTGAGDSFAAGFLVAYSRGESPQSSAQAGHRSAREFLCGAD